MVASDPRDRNGDKEKRELLRLQVLSSCRWRVSDTNPFSIHANGGQYVQVVKGTEPILVVYGGTSTRKCIAIYNRINFIELFIPAYDIKLIMQKDLHDTILPSWIYDCVEQKRKIPLSQK